MIYRNISDVVEFDKWNRKILNTFWHIVLISFVTEIIIFFLVAIPRGDGNFLYFKSYVLKPLLLNMLLFSITELCYPLIKNKFKEAPKYLIIIAGTLLVCNLVYIHYAVSIIYVVFIFPIMLSVYYGNKKITLFALALNLAAYFAIVFLYLPTKPIEKVNHSLTDLCTNIAFMISAVLLVYSFVNRSQEILQSFVSMYENEQELALKNFVMELNSKIEPVTELYNHKTFYEHLESLIEQSRRFNFPLSLAVLDIDNFKRVNDTYGHSVGDDVIKSLAKVIKSNIRSDDYAARYGGEEFAIIFTDKDQIKAFEAAERIRIAFNNISINSIDSERFSVSIGVCELSEAVDKQTLFAFADHALYSAKRTGKNRTIIYEKS